MQNAARVESEEKKDSMGISTYDFAGCAAIRQYHQSATGRPLKPRN
jgi:hypothetical protein